MRSRHLLIVAMLAHASLATAEPEPDPGAKRRAGELATQSAAHYKRGEFEISVALLRQAYALYPEPNLLYNLARSLESLGDQRGALDAYKQYLAAAPKIEDRGAIERRIATLEAELAEKAPREQPAPPSAPVPQPEARTLPPPVVDETPSRLPWVLMLGGAGIVGGGLWSGSRAYDRHDAAVASGVASDATALQDQAHRYATIANVMFVAGGVAIAGGLAWQIFARRSSRDTTARDTSIRAHVGPGSIALELSFP